MKIFNIIIRVIYLDVFNEFVYENQFVIEIDTHIKFIEKNKKKYHARLHILQIL